MNPGPRSFALRSTRVVTPNGVGPAIVVIESGKIQRVESIDVELATFVVDDLGDLVISPGVIDAHVHINEPGTNWEGFETATRAAAAGGVTTIVDMPLNSIPVTTDAIALAEKRSAAAGKCWVDVGFYGGLVPGNADQLPALIEAGVLGIKAFLCHSGLDEFPNATEQDLRAAMPLLARAGVPLLVHAELLTLSSPAVTDVRSFSQFVTSRPEQWELDAIELMIRLCREYRCPVHIVHLATSTALPIIAAAKQERLPITVETCPHYLFFDGTKISDGDTRFKCAPPIRTGEATLLFGGLLDGTIDTIGSDHSPCPLEMKSIDTGNFSTAWGGIASVQLTLSAVWTFLGKQGCHDLSLLSRWLAVAPAELVGLAHRKGKIAPGYDADLVVWDPDPTWTIQGDELFHRHNVTPYDGFTVSGKVTRTYVRGNLVFADGVHREQPIGQMLSRTPTKVLRISVAERINSWSEQAAREAFENCCAAPGWIEQMLKRCPFASDAEVVASASEIWWSLPREEWLAAFAAHPKIGDLESLQKKYRSTAGWASGEQASVAQARNDTLRDLARYNREYEERFGHIFIVCATGKSADEMLALLESRLSNEASTELNIAAAEQLKITLLRLEKLAA
ncbi:Allantoinase [Anatilimnocola aggregata]|uniref:allantoinase n=1 Tax=Anatilimnocola aggregata TaxID=2528021 RepID=A0A517YDG7_9BACT|nr:allantoinase AllB [Anatilimnocola aggregata]QDU28281.1 Allantoinase [Anatilimnocola aggregata]